MACIRLVNLVKQCSPTATAVAGGYLDIADGKCMICVGSFGCGKTTILNLVTGLEQHTRGQVIIR